MVASDNGGTALAASTPHVATIAVTYNCQCDCGHCSAVDYQRETARNGHGLKYEELKSAIEQTMDLGTTCVILTGGEPLLLSEDLRPDPGGGPFPQRLHPLQQRRVSDRTVRVAKLKEAGLYGVYVSLDHADAARHDENRGRPGLFAKATRGLEFCREAGILTGISTYATRETMQNGELDALMDVARELQVLEVFLFDVIPTGRLSDHRECLLTDDEARQIIEFRKKYIEKRRLPAHRPPDHVRQHRLSVRRRGLSGGHGSTSPAGQWGCLALRLHAVLVRQHPAADVARDLGLHGGESAVRAAVGTLPSLPPRLLGPARRTHLAVTPTQQHNGAGERVVLTGATGFLGQEILQAAA